MEYLFEGGHWPSSKLLCFEWAPLGPTPPHPPQPSQKIPYVIVMKSSSSHCVCVMTSLSKTRWKCKTLGVRWTRQHAWKSGATDSQPHDARSSSTRSSTMYIHQRRKEKNSFKNCSQVLNSYVKNIMQLCNFITAAEINKITPNTAGQNF